MMIWGDFSIRLKNDVRPEIVAALKQRGFTVQWLHQVTGNFANVGKSNVVPPEAANVYALMTGGLEEEDINDLLSASWLRSFKIEKRG